MGEEGQMGKEEQKFIKEFKKQFIRTLVGALFIIIATSVGFYFNTQATFEQQDTRIQRIEKELKLLDGKKANKSQIIGIERDLKVIREDTREIREIILENYTKPE